MVVIQVILIVAVVGVAGMLLRGRSAAKIRAWQKLIMLGFVGLAIVSIIWPELTNDLADVVGVGRGADLLLYGMIVGFVVFALNTYFKFKELEHRHVKLARKIALLEVKQRNSKK